MGNITPSYIKRAAEKMMNHYSSIITSDFEINKTIVDEYSDVSKKDRNKIAGYLVVLKINEHRIITSPKAGPKEKRGTRKRKKQRDENRNKRFM